MNFLVKRFVIKTVRTVLNDLIFPEVTKIVNRTPSKYDDQAVETVIKLCNDALDRLDASM